MKDNIEEEKKILEGELCTLYKKWDSRGAPLPIIMRKILCRVLGEKQLFPQPLDGKELREKMADIIYCVLNTTRTDTWGHYKRMHPSKTYYEIAADQILALLRPKIEEAFNEGVEKNKELIAQVKQCQDVIKDLKSNLVSNEEAKGQERKRIDGLYCGTIDLYLPIILEEAYSKGGDCKYMTQALAKCLKDELGKVIKGVE